MKKKNGILNLLTLGTVGVTVIEIAMIIQKYGTDDILRRIGLVVFIGSFILGAIRTYQIRKRQKFQAKLQRVINHSKVRK